MFSFISRVCFLASCFVPVGHFVHFLLYCFFVLGFVSFVVAKILAAKSKVTSIVFTVNLELSQSVVVPVNVI